MKIFLDSNIFLRYFTPEDKNSYEECSKIFHAIEIGTHQPYTSAIVTLECSYVLKKLYTFSRNQVAGAIGTLLSMRNLTIVETTDTIRAFDLHQNTGIKFSDCLIATQVPKGVTLVTYDHDFAKLHGLIVQTPKEVLRLSPQI